MEIIRRIFQRKKRFAFFLHEQGVHQVGGTSPSGFTFPDHSFITTIQYIGYLSNADRIFDWMPFDLHLICPIFLDIDLFCLDYSDPLAPKIIYPRDQSSITCAFDETDALSQIVYEPVRLTASRYSVDESYDNGDSFGLAGIPEWIQAERKLKCPKSGKQMRFVCQLKSDHRVKGVKDIDVGQGEFYNSYFNRLNFWCDGDLFVFMEPESKTVCYFIQNT